jgi:CRP-like cAMP-binding protein
VRPLNSRTITGSGLRAEGLTHSLVKALRAVPSLAPLDDHTLLAIVGDSANLFWRAGSTVYERGAPADALYIILSGSVRVLGARGEVATFTVGDYFGELSLLLGTDHGHEVHAVEDCELMVVPKERFDDLLAGNPALAETIRRRAEDRRAANLAAER